MPKVATAVIQSGKVPGTVSNRLVKVRLSKAPLALWNTVKDDGSDLRAYNDGGTTQYPCFVHPNFNKTAHDGILYVRVEDSISGSANTKFEIHADGTSSAEAVGATYGRNNTFQDFGQFLLYDSDGSGGADSITDVTGGGRDATPVGTTLTAGAYAIGSEFNHQGSLAISDNDDDHLELGSVALGDLLQLHGQDWELGAILQPLSGIGDFARIYDKSDGGSGANGVSINYGNNWNTGIEVYCAGALRLNATTTFTTAAWHAINVTHVWNSGAGDCDLEAFENAVSIGSAAGVVSPPDAVTNAAWLDWNHSATNRNFNGRASELYITTTIMTANEREFLVNTLKDTDDTVKFEGVTEITMNSPCYLMWNVHTGETYFADRIMELPSSASVSKCAMAYAFGEYFGLTDKASWEAHLITTVTGDDAQTGLIVVGEVWTAWQAILAAWLASDNSVADTMTRHMGQDAIDNSSPIGSSSVARTRGLEIIDYYLNTVAGAPGMPSAANWTTGHGFGGDGNPCSPNEWRNLMSHAGFNENLVFQDVFRRHSAHFEVDDGASGTTFKNPVNGAAPSGREMPGYRGFKGGLGGGGSPSGSYHALNYIAMPNGEKCGVMCAAADSRQETGDDLQTLYDAAIADHPELDEPTVAFTPLTMANRIGGTASMVTWSKDSSMFQDDAELTPADDASEPIKVIKSLMFRTTDADLVAPETDERPARQADGSWQGDGVDDHLEFATTFGNTSFMVDNNDPFILFCSAAWGSDGVWFGKRSAGGGQLNCYVDPSGADEPGFELRGSSASVDHAIGDGNRHVAMLMWDNVEDRAYIVTDVRGPHAIRPADIGSDAEETGEKVMFGARGTGTPAAANTSTFHMGGAFDVDWSGADLWDMQRLIDYAMQRKVNDTDGNSRLATLSGDDPVTDDALTTPDKFIDIDLHNGTWIN